MTLLESTRKLLAAKMKTMTLREISRASDGEVEFEWLRKFADEKSGVKDPTVTRVQRLHDFLLKLKTKSAA